LVYWCYFIVVTDFIDLLTLLNMLTSNNLIPWLGFSLFEGIGPMRFRALVDYFGSAKDAWEASEKRLKEIGVSDKMVTKFIHHRTSYDFHSILAVLSQKNIQVVIQTNPSYPQLLKQIPDPPIVLYVRGDVSVLSSQPCVGVVGTRKITQYGRDVTKKVSSGLALSGITVVSGMAYGVDTVAHESAIDSGGKTIAVLGCGVDIIYPRTNDTLYWSIIRKFGAVVSEFPPGMRTAIGLFPSRNRIISGLSLGTVVTEGASDSGALITAKAALEQGREVFAVPGPVTSAMSAAPTILLRQGAKLVTEAKDILEELNIKNPASPAGGNIKNTNKISNLTNLSKEERSVIELLQNESLHFDDLVRLSHIPSSKLASILTMLEMKGYVRKCDGDFAV
jgi:DNA processing protein